MAVSRANSNMRLNRIIFYLILTISALAGTGNLLSRETEGFAMIGLTTFLSLLLIALCVLNLSRLIAFKEEKFLVISLAFGLYCMFTGLLAYAPVPAAFRAFMFMLYALIMYGVYSSRLHEGQVKLLFLCAGLGMSGVVLISLADFYGYVYIQGVNEISRSITAMDADYLLEAGSLSGPFRSRTEFVTYISLIFPAALWFAIRPKSGVLYRLAFILTTGVLFMGAIAAGSRGFYLSVAAVLAFYGYLTVRSFDFRFIAWSIAGAILSLGLVFFLKEDMFVRFLAQLKTLAPDEVMIHQGDSLRFQIWKAALLDVLYFPIGRGIGRVQAYPGVYLDSHNIFIEWIHAAGVVGVGYVCYFCLRIWGSIKLVRYNPILIPLAASICSFFIFNMTHSQWGTGLFWIYMGLFLYNVRLAIHRKNDPNFHYGGLNRLGEFRRLGGPGVGARPPAFQGNQIQPFDQ